MRHTMMRRIRYISVEGPYKIRPARRARSDTEAGAALAP